MLTAEHIRALALQVGLDDCACVRVCEQTHDGQFMDRWVAQGKHGQMDYLEHHRNERYDPQVLVPGAQTIVIGLLSYEHSGRDYHRAVKSRLYRLEAALRETNTEDLVVSEGQHIFCDSAPFLERRWCVEAGLGAIGRNHQLIHPTLGSYVHPGELVLNCAVEGAITPSMSKQRLPLSDACAECHRCTEACPTGALRQADWDATRCIAYTTHHCLVCQQACPLNKQIHPQK